VRAMSDASTEYKRPYIFISYASEDHAMASVVEDALTSVSKELEAGLEVFRDVHSLERGLSLSDQIMVALEKLISCSLYTPKG
jgi:hypothetical protein